MMEDAELLRRYVMERSPDAFAELVRRRVDLVYAVALRQVGGDAHRAEDVTPKVFADPARKAPARLDRTVLSGWLYRSTRYAASDVVRSERRRRAREPETTLVAGVGSDEWVAFESATVNRLYAKLQIPSARRSNTSTVRIRFTASGRFSSCTRT